MHCNLVFDGPTHKIQLNAPPGYQDIAQFGCQRESGKKVGFISMEGKNVKVLFNAGLLLERKLWIRKCQQSLHLDQGQISILTELSFYPETNSQASALCSQTRDCARLAQNEKK